MVSVAVGGEEGWKCLVCHKVELVESSANPLISINKSSTKLITSCGGPEPNHSSKAKAENFVDNCKC